MNLRRATSISFVVYIATFLVTLLASRLLGLEFINSETITRTMWLLTLIITTVLSAIGARWYFAAPRVPASLKQGAMFGAVIIAVGFALDLLIAIPILLGEVGMLQELLSYYSNAWFLVTLGAILFVSGAVGCFCSRKQAISIHTD